MAWLLSIYSLAFSPGFRTRMAASPSMAICRLLFEIGPAADLSVRSEIEIRVVHPLVLAALLNELLSGFPIFTAGRPIRLHLEFLRPLPQGIAEPGHLGLQRRQSKFIPDLLGILHELACRKRDRREGPLQHGIDQHCRVGRFVVIVI